MKCPNCENEFKPRYIGDVQVDECRACKGIWFDRGELNKVKDRLDPDLRWMDFELWKHKDRVQLVRQPRACPKCAADMVSIEYGDTGVDVDLCPKCSGVWLSIDKFRNIIEALSEELETKNLSGYVRETLEEAKDIVRGPESFISEWRDLLTVFRLLEYRILSENPKLHEALIRLQTGSPVR